ncbi:MAG: DUF1858 domain-containing protein [Clostridia bacterium]
MNYLWGGRLTIFTWNARSGMGGTIDLSKTVYEICRDDPAVVDIMREAGFESITGPGMLATVGRFMTIPKGAALKGIPMERIRAIFIEKGYNLK